MNRNIRRLISMMVLCVLLIARAAAADQAAELQKIKAAISSGDVLEAQGLIEDFLEEYPSGHRSWDMLYLLGRLQYRRAAYKEAAEAFSRLLEEHPQGEHVDRALYGLAMSQMGMLEYFEASETLGALYSEHPQSELRPDALYWLGESFYRRADYEAASGKFEQFLQLYPADELREYALDSAGWCLEQLGRHRDAVAKRSQFLSQYKNGPLSEAAEFCLAADLARTGNHLAAVEHYLRVAETSSQKALQEQASLRAGVLLAKLNRTEDSVSMLERSMPGAGRTDRVLGQAVLGNLHLKMHEYAKARMLFEGLLRENKQDEYAADIQLGLAYIGLGRFDDAAFVLSGADSAETDPLLAERRALALVSASSNLENPDASLERAGALVTQLEPPQRSVDLLYALGKALILSNQYDHAREIFAGLSMNSRFCSSHPEVYYCWGLCLYQQAQYAAARGAFEKFLESAVAQPLRVPVHYLLASSCAEAGDFEHALKLYKSLLEKAPPERLKISALYRAGLLSLLMKKYDPALSFLREAAAADPSLAEPAIFFSGIAHLRNGQPHEAVRLYESPEQDGPLAEKAAVAKGLAAFACGNYEKADGIFRDYVRQYPDSEILYAALFFAAASRYKRGSASQAGAEFARFTGRYPSNKLSARALMYAGLCAERSDRPHEALAFYDQALQADLPVAERAAASVAQASARLAAGEGRQALALFETLVEQRGAVGEYAGFWTGRLRFASGDWKQARTALEKFSREYSASPLADDALFFSARAARMDRDYRAAMRSFERVNDQYPGSSFADQATIEAAECMIEAGEAGAALKVFSEFIEHNVNSSQRPLVLYDMGRILERAGEFEEAIDQYKAAAGGDMGELAAGSRFAIAKCLAELDRNDEAIAELVGMVRGSYPPGWAERAQLEVARLLERGGRVEEARHVYAAVAQAYRPEAAGMVAMRALNRLTAKTVISAR